MLQSYLHCPALLYTFVSFCFIALCLHCPAWWSFPTSHLISSLYMLTISNKWETKAQALLGISFSCKTDKKSTGESQPCYNDVIVLSSDNLSMTATTTRAMMATTPTTDTMIQSSPLALFHVHSAQTFKERYICSNFIVGDSSLLYHSCRKVCLLRLQINHVVAYETCTEWPDDKEN